MEVNAEYLRKLSKEGSKTNIKFNEILDELAKVAESGLSSHDFYINEEYDELYKGDIITIEEMLRFKGLDVITTSEFDDDNMTNIWTLDISWY